MDGAAPRLSLLGKPPLDWGPSLFGRSADIAVFGGSAALALGVAAAALHFGFAGLGDMGWLVLVLGVDVAHVHATWFRTYFDKEELSRHPLRYVLVPLLVYAAGVVLYGAGQALFWRVLAYVAAFHFVRQQAGWVAVYRARSGRSGFWERFVDDGAVYAATLFPLLYFHVHRDGLAFAWFVPGDFVRVDLEHWLPTARAVWAAFLGAFVARESWRAFVRRRVELGKSLIVLTTALTWYVGIVATNSDSVFTATNVIPHGVPYAVLLFNYARHRARAARDTGVAHVVAGGFGAFVLVLLGLAFVEQLLWDRFVDHERPWLFGSGAELDAALLAWIVPLLTIPQATHYVLDGLVWRRSENGVRPAQRATLGFAGADDSAIVPNQTVGGEV